MLDMQDAFFILSIRKLNYFKANQEYGY